MVMLFVGTIAAIGLLEQTSLVVALIGFVLILFGRMTLRTHWFAIAYLLLMIPIWNYPIDLLQDPSRILSARIAVALLRVIGFPVFRQGTNIMLPEHTLAVLRECSGVNQLIALTAMVLPAAYLWLPTVTRRAAIIAIGVAVSYLGNGVRIALTGWLTVKGLSDGNPGTLHLSEGLAISAVGYMVIGFCFSVLSKSVAGARVQPEVAADGSAAQGWFASRRVAIDRGPGDGVGSRRQSQVLGRL
jgi:exosortase